MNEALEPRALGSGKWTFVGPDKIHVYRVYGVPDVCSIPGRCAARDLLPTVHFGASMTWIHENRLKCIGL
jgi:hypothetical protein